MATVTRTKTKPPEYRKRLITRNYSSRNGRPIQAVAIHSTESNDVAKSWDDLEGVRAWFDHPQAQASSHLGIDGDGHVEQWVKFEDKAWTILDLNSVTLNIEFVGRAAQEGSAWEEDQIKAGARWTAYFCHCYDIPVQRGIVKNVHGVAVISKKGVITHKQLTDAGFGSHQDPGPKFPMKKFLESTQWYFDNGWVPNK